MFSKISNVTWALFIFFMFVKIAIFLLESQLGTTILNVLKYDYRIIDNYYLRSVCKKCASKFRSAWLLAKLLQEILHGWVIVQVHESRRLYTLREFIPLFIVGSIFLRNNWYDGGAEQSLWLHDTLVYNHVALYLCSLVYVEPRCLWRIRGAN